MADSRKFLCLAVLLALAAGLGAFYAAPCALHEESLALLGLPAPPAAAAATPLAMVLRQLVHWLGMTGIGTYEATLGLTAGARVLVQAGGSEAHAELAIDDAVPAQSCVIHIGSALAARLPASTSVKLGSA